jgi:hypothetical protein
MDSSDNRHLLPSLAEIAQRVRDEVATKSGDRHYRHLPPLRRDSLFTRTLQAVDAHEVIAASRALSDAKQAVSDARNSLQRVMFEAWRQGGTAQALGNYAGISHQAVTHNITSYWVREVKPIEDESDRRREERVAERRH